MTRTFMKSDISTSTGFILHETILPAGQEYPLHWHDYLELELIVSGQARHMHNHRCHLDGPGTLYMMHYHDFHSITALTELRLYSAHFHKTMLDPILWDYLGFYQFHAQLNEAENQWASQRLTELKQEGTSPQLFAERAAHHILSELTILLLRKSAPQEIKQPPLPLQQAIAWLNENFLNDISLKDLAAHLSYSPNYLGHLFRNQLGCNYSDYVHTLRLKHACNLLQTTELPVQEIAFSSGYNSVEYFLYSFKKNMKMTPTEYRLGEVIHNHLNIPVLPSKDIHRPDF